MVLKVKQNPGKSPVGSLKQKGYDTHFRKYLKSNHPALIVGETNTDYNFHRVTSASKSGHHSNIKIDPNPDKSKKTPMYIVKQKEKDKKNRFSKWKYPWKV